MTEVDKDPQNDVGKPPERWISFFGFVIVQKADILAAAAFLLSIVSLIYQASLWISGPKPSIYSPDFVYVYFDKYANNRTLVRFVAPISFVNTAEAGHDAIVRDITLSVALSSLRFSQHWLSFASVQRDREKLSIMPLEIAHPFPIGSGSAVSHTVTFAPTEQSCGSSGADCEPDRDYVSDTSFLETSAKTNVIDLSFTARVIGRERPLIATCKVQIGVGLRQYLAENDWFAARCVP